MCSDFFRQPRSPSKVVQAPHCDSLRTPEWWADQRLAAPRIPGRRALSALAHDALSASMLDAAPLPPAASAALFLEHVLASWDLRGRGTDSDKESSSAGWPEWAGAAPLASPLAALALHAMKLQCAGATAYLWAAFVGAIAYDHCDPLDPWVNPREGVSVGGLRGATPPAAAAAAADPTREHSLHFAPPHLAVVLDHVNESVTELALRAEEAAAAAAPRATFTGRRSTISGLAPITEMEEEEEDGGDGDVDGRRASFEAGLRPEDDPAWSLQVRVVAVLLQRIRTPKTYTHFIRGRPGLVLAGTLPPQMFGKPLLNNALTVEHVQLQKS